MKKSFTLSYVVINNEKNIIALINKQYIPIKTRKGVNIFKIFCNPSNLFSNKSIFSFFEEIILKKHILLFSNHLFAYIV